MIVQSAYSLDRTNPDIRYFLGSSYIGCQYPLTALDVMCGAPTSRKEMEWVQDLAIGIAFSRAVRLDILEFCARVLVT